MLQRRKVRAPRMKRRGASCSRDQGCRRGSHKPACITYSNACVGELLTRFRKLGVGEDDRLLLSTVHSFCLTELVLPYGSMAGVDIPDPLIVASTAQSREVFQEAYKRTLGG